MGNKIEAQCFLSGAQNMIVLNIPQNPGQANSWEVPIDRKCDGCSLNIKEGKRSLLVRDDPNQPPQVVECAIIKENI